MKKRRSDRESMIENKKLKKVAIVVPIYRANLLPEEEVSLKHLRHYLGHYDKYVQVSDNLDVEWEGFTTVKLSKKLYPHYELYNTRLKSKAFYSLFSDYEYILIYQLDCLVFSDQLLQWCEKGYDYIGAPWFHVDVQGANVNYVFKAVGNGGFSLRNVQSSLKVLDAYHQWDARAGRIFRSCKRFAEGIHRKTEKLLAYGKKAFYAPLSKHYHDLFLYSIESSAVAEDRFWAYEANQYYPDFKIAPFEEALAFSFEGFPRHCYKLNGNQLPFGCHAWFKKGHWYDRGFWEEFLLK